MALRNWNVTRSLLLAFGLTALAPVANAIDVWDLNGGDNSSATDNELTHGSDQLHDLQSSAGVADQDWFRLSQKAYASYEVIVDGLTEEIAEIPSTASADLIQVDEVDSTGVIQTAGTSISPIGSARSLRFRNTTATEDVSRFIRVRTGSNGCTTTCTTNAEYRIRLRETTLMIPRYNNSGSQITVLILQNGGDRTTSGSVRFWDSTGALVASQGFTINPRGLYVLQTQTVSGVAGTSGSMTVDHVGRYGELVGKSVALEPSTGFSFDTPALPRLH